MLSHQRPNVPHMRGTPPQTNGSSPRQHQQQSCPRRTAPATRGELCARLIGFLHSAQKPWARLGPPWTLQTIQKMEQKFRMPNLYSFHATCSANASKVSSRKFGERYAQGDAHSSGKKRLQTAEIRTGSPSPNPPPCPSGRGTARQETRALQGNTHPCNRFESDTICHFDAIIPKADPPRRGIILHDPRHPNAAQAELQ